MSTRNHNNEPITYTIKEISTLFHIPASTLRYYEDLGLLKNVSRSSSKQRIYAREHIQRLQAIHCFKQTGLSITKMQKFFQYEENLPEYIEEILTLVMDHEQHIKEEITRLQSELLHINDKVTYYSAVKKALANGEQMPCWEDIIN